jgi:hypothetical protein
VLVAIKVLHMVVQVLNSGVKMNKVISYNIKSWPRVSCVDVPGLLNDEEKKTFPNIAIFPWSMPGKNRRLATDVPVEFEK